MGKLESKFKSDLKAEIESKYPGSKVLYLDPQLNHQGIPDLIVLTKKGWAMLEGKITEDAKHRPNQDYWVDFYNDLSFARFIYPENKEQVLHEMEQSHKLGRKARLPRSK